MLKTVSLALDVLRMFTKEKSEWGGRELAAQLGENHTKIYRVLETMEHHKFLSKNPETKKYSLGLSVWELGNTLNESFKINRVIHPILVELSEETNESVFFTVLDGSEGITFDAVEAKSTVRFSVSVGSRTPLYAGASYRAILAHQSNEFIEEYLKQDFHSFTEKTMIDPIQIQEHLVKIRQEGIAVSEGEYTEDVIAIAIPIKMNGSVRGSLTVSGPSYRVDTKHISHFKKALDKAKIQLEEVLKNSDANLDFIR